MPPRAGIKLDAITRSTTVIDVGPRGSFITIHSPRVRDRCRASAPEPASPDSSTAPARTVALRRGSTPPKGSSLRTRIGRPSPPPRSDRRWRFAPCARPRRAHLRRCSRSNNRVERDPPSPSRRLSRARRPFRRGARPSRNTGRGSPSIRRTSAWPRATLPPPLPAREPTPFCRRRGAPPLRIGDREPPAGSRSPDNRTRSSPHGPHGFPAAASRSLSRCWISRTTVPPQLTSRGGVSSKRAVES